MQISDVTTYLQNTIQPRTRKQFEGIDPEISKWAKTNFETARTDSFLTSVAVSFTKFTVKVISSAIMIELINQYPEKSSLAAGGVLALYTVLGICGAPMAMTMTLIYDQLAGPVFKYGAIGLGLKALKTVLENFDMPFSSLPGASYAKYGLAVLAAIPALVAVNHAWHRHQHFQTAMKAIQDNDQEKAILAISQGLDLKREIDSPIDTYRGKLQYDLLGAATYHGCVRVIFYLNMLGVDAKMGNGFLLNDAETAKWLLKTGVQFSPRVMEYRFQNDIPRHWELIKVLVKNKQYSKEIDDTHALKHAIFHTKNVYDKPKINGTHWSKYEVENILKAFGVKKDLVANPSSPGFAARLKELGCGEIVDQIQTILNAPELPSQ